MGSWDLFIDKAHTALDIFRMLPNPICGFFFFGGPFINVSTTIFISFQKWDKKLVYEGPIHKDTTCTHSTHYGWPKQCNISPPTSNALPCWLCLKVAIIELLWSWNQRPNLVIICQQRNFSEGNIANKNIILDFESFQYKLESGCYNKPDYTIQESLCFNLFGFESSGWSKISIQISKVLSPKHFGTKNHRCSQLLLRWSAGNNDGGNLPL